MLLSRATFAGALFLYALIAQSSPAGAGWCAVGASLVLFFALLFKREGTGAALRDPYLWITGAIVVILDVCSITAASLLPLPAFAAINQCSPLIALLIAPLWGEYPLKRDWLLLLLGLSGALLVVGGNLEGVPPLGFLAALAMITIVSVSVHRWGHSARQEKHNSLAATLVLFLPSLPLVFLGGFSFSSIDISLYLLAGLLLALGNWATYTCYKKDWSVTSSLLLKPLSTVFLAGAGVLFLSDPLGIATIIGAVLILIASSIVGAEHGKKEVAVS